MFYLTSNADEQKRINWGWMNIEDWDFNIEDKQISSITFKNKKSNEK